MSKIDRDAGRKFLDKQTFSRGKTQVKVYNNKIDEAVMLLCGNPIAKIGFEGIEITDAGYPTDATRNRLNGILEQTTSKLRVANGEGKFALWYAGDAPKGKSKFHEFSDWVNLAEVTETFKPEPILIPTATPTPKATPDITITPKAKYAKCKVSEQVLSVSTGITETEARNLLQIFDYDLKELARQSQEAIVNLKVKGIGKAKARRITAALQLGKELATQHGERVKVTSPADIAEIMMPKMRYEQQEVVSVLALDTKGNIKQKGVISDGYEGALLQESRAIFKGTLNASVFHPREIFRFAIEAMANSIILCHNHPSGDPQPSQEDIRATKQLIEAGNQIGIKVLDHVIIGDGIFISLKEENFI